MVELTRRQFARAAGAVSALSYSRVRGANERVRVGYIGLGNRGDQVQDAFLEHGDQETVAICDLRDDYLDWAEAKEKKRNLSPKRFRDYRKLLEVKDVDAVVISTPDHWHALMFIDACRAGKDVYVEKPLSLTIKEGGRMVEVARETGRVTQVGIHRRSSPFLIEAAKLVQSGYLGHITMARGFHYRNEWPRGIGKPNDAQPPNPAEWDQWLGPAPMQPYNRNKTYYNFRWFYNFSTGQLSNFGVHYMDMLRWALGLEWPKSVTAMGGKYAMEDNREIPDTMEALWEYDGGHMINFSQSNASIAPGNAQGAEMIVRGTKGTMYLHESRWEVVPEPVSDSALFPRSPIDREGERANRGVRKPMIEGREMKGSQDTAFHARDFLDCVKSRQKCNCDILDGHISTAATLMANIAHRTRTYLNWDGNGQRFTNSEEANRWLQYEYRAPYKLT
ncbi:MAG: Gfo/Idh/MocA family oxidoreductase [Bryobacteraceae bacterium]|nr:Gfo/Idh/MocA family oxidoreductase [Bryobacteraceae bacterium]